MNEEQRSSFTVGRLRESLEHLPDDAELVIVDDDVVGVVSKTSPSFLLMIKLRRHVYE